MVDVVVVNDVVLIHVLGSRTITAENDATAAKVIQTVARCLNPLAMEIKTDTRSTAIPDDIGIELTVFGMTETDHSVSLIIHLPVMLQALVALKQGIPLTMDEGQPLEVNVFGKRAVLLTLDSNELL